LKIENENKKNTYIEILKLFQEKDQEEESPLAKGLKFKILVKIFQKNLYNAELILEC